MIRFSANLGLLWRDLPLPEAIRAAARAGFDAVECHWPYDVPAADIRAALAETGLPMLGLNTATGGTGAFGLSALPDRQAEAIAAVDQAVACAEAVGAQAIHVMAGLAEGPAAREAFLQTLDYACAAAPDRTILIEPINTRDVPGYFLTGTGQAAAIIAEMGRPNLRMMFDLYHMQIMEGDLTRRLERLLPLIGHIQFAGVPDRGRPDRGEVNFPQIFDHLERLGWTRPLGAEYRSEGPTEPTLDWLTAWRGPTRLR